MNTIRLLPTHEAQKIAAGEVIQRPANVIKELMENALDAGATSIRIEIDQAGKKRMRIVDNGCGMSPSDARMCFLPHATSKIDSVAQLSTIKTFGFRGEALASISAVSKVTLRTKTVKQETTCGTQVTIDGTSPEPVIEEVSCTVGCDITIEDLFYNTLPRKKFLKRDETEWYQIISIIHAFCLSNKHIQVTVVRDGTTTLNAPPTKNVPARISQIWGHNTAENFFALSDNSAGKSTKVQISGMISQPHWWRYNRGHMLFFVNGRVVKNSILGKGVLNGYKNILPPQRYPGACLFLTIDRQAIDVNVHPQKDEVQFSHPGLVQKAVAEHITAALESYTQQTIAPQAPSLPPVEAPAMSAKPTQVLTPEPATQAMHISLPETLPIITPQAPHKPLESAPAQPKAVPTQPPIQEAQKKILTSQKPTILGQLFTTYIMLEKDNEFILVDQHAAHERILYERFATRYAKQDGVALLFPQLITVPAEHVDQIEELSDLFADHGITIDRSGDTQFALRSAPAGATTISGDEMMMEIIQLIEEHAAIDSATIRMQIREHLHSHLVCKSAIKAGDVLDTRQMQQIIDDLAQTKNRFICAHGRPTSWTVPQATIEKHFKRRL